MSTNLDQLETPPLVVEMLERLNPRAEDRAYWQREFNLSYHFGGLAVVAESTACGLMLVASGPAGSFGELLESLPADRTRRLVYLTPDVLAEHLAALPRTHEAVAG